MGWERRHVRLTGTPRTYRDRRVARFWSATSGLDDEAIDALNTGRATAVVEPDRDGLLEQLDVELPVAKAHLRSILDRHWDQEWQRANRYDTSPEDQLWRAASAVTEIEAAIHERTG